MTYKTFTHKLKIARVVFKEQGVLGVAIRSLQLLQKKLHKPKTKKIETIAIQAHYEEVLLANPHLPANRNWRGRTKKKLTLSWLMPPPGKGSGGHMTLFRFINYLEQHGHTCRIYFFNPSPDSSAEGVRAVMGDSFPPVKAEMAWLQPGEQMAKSDGIFATRWDTAYSVYASKLDAKKFYFVQDFEPYFYPVGSFSVLAENTYKLGLRGITAGNWLATKLHQDYGMVTDSFSFGSDSAVYRYENNQPRQEIMFYARPYTERRGFELGILTLDLFHRQHPEVTINFIGWDVSTYPIPFPYNNLGILEHDELNELYNRCAAGLVMSLTNMSLLPLELLSSGCIPVVNQGPNNSLVSDNPYIHYSENDPISLATALSDIIKRQGQAAYAQKASQSVQNCSWDESGRQFVKIVERSIAARGEK